MNHILVDAMGTPFFEVQIELSDKKLAVMLRTRDLGEANTYADQLRHSGKYRRNLILVVLA